VEKGDWSNFPPQFCVLYIMKECKGTSFSFTSTKKKVYSVYCQYMAEIVSVIAALLVILEGQITRVTDMLA
jgi:hypothetical protein